MSNDRPSRAARELEPEIVTDLKDRLTYGGYLRLDRILGMATALLAEHRVMVLAVAHALETHKTIGGDDVAAIFQGRQGPRVDGRAYHHPSFRAVAESYHVQALEAHRQTGQVDVPLPVLAPVVPVRAAWSPPVPVALAPPRAPGDGR